MQSPSVVHPKKFEIRGMFFEVVSYSKLTDDQARAIALNFYRSQKFTKKHQGTLFQVVTIFDEQTANLL